MPFSIDTATRYQYLIYDVFDKAHFETSADMDLFIDTMKPLYDKSTAAPLNRKYRHLLIELDEIAEGFDLFVGEDILTRATINKAPTSGSPETRIPAFTFMAITHAGKMAEARQAYTQLIQETIANKVKLFSAMDAAQRQQYIDRRREDKKESQTIPANFKPKEDKAVIGHDENIQLHAARDYIHLQTQHRLKDHARRACQIRIPGLFRLTPAVREYEYERFLMHAKATQPSPEILFRAVEVFPKHRHDLFDQFELLILTQAQVMKYAEILYYAFPTQLPDLQATLEEATVTASLAATQLAPENPLFSMYDHIPENDPDRERNRIARVTITYLSTGYSYPGAPRPLPTLPAANRLSEGEARAEVQALWPEQLFALQYLFKKGLRRYHLCAWQPESIYDRFTAEHTNALVYLMEQIHYGPNQAIQLISRKTRAAVETIYNPPATVVVNPVREEKEEKSQPAQANPLPSPRSRSRFS